MTLYFFQSKNPHHFESDSTATQGSVAAFIYHCVQLRLSSDRLFMTLLIPHKPFFLVAPRGFVDVGVVLQWFRNPYTGNAFLEQRLWWAGKLGWWKGWIWGVAGWQSPMFRGSTIHQVCTKPLKEQPGFKAVNSSFRSAVCGCTVRFSCLQ